jgi:DNA-directed RNA polymerase subunit RPC12/RpoP
VNAKLRAIFGPRFPECRLTMPNPLPENEIDYRSRAHGHVRAAKELLINSDQRSPFYACLELRMAIEALAYDAFQQYSFEVSAKSMNQWTPKKILDELVYIDPWVELTSSITITVNATETAPAQEIALGEIRRLSAKWANKMHNALGNFLHQPTLKQFQHMTDNVEKAAREKAGEATVELERILSAPVLQFRAHRLVETKCECGYRIARDREFLLAGKKVTCSDCGREYNYSHDKQTDAFAFTLRRVLWQCLACKESNSFGIHELEPERKMIITCTNCGESVEVGMVPQLRAITSDKRAALPQCPPADT